MEYYKNKRYLLYGNGVSNQAVKRFFDEHNYTYLEFTDNDTTTKIDDLLNRIDVVIKSPGIKPETILLEKAHSKKKQIINDIELFYRLFKPKHIIGVTGTNGKTTTAKLIACLLNKVYHVHLCGNIGNPIFNETTADFEKDYFVIELSSFMLHDVSELQLEVGVITNITEHHLDWHKNLQNYKNTKLHMLDCLKQDKGIAILGINVKLCNFIKTYQVIQKNNRLMIDDISIDCRSKELLINNKKVFTIRNDELSTNFELFDAIIACFIAIKQGIPLIEINKGLNTFEKEHYRNELIYKNENFSIINDAKSTNPSSTLVLLNAYLQNKNKVILIFGGKTNDDNYAQLLFLLKKRKNCFYKIIGYGELSEKLEKNFRLLNLDFVKETTLKSAFKSLIKLLDDFKGIVIYSPAAQSYDQFSNYEERGKLFTELVNKQFKTI